MKNVLIISYAFPPLSIAGTFRPMKFVKYLSEFGWDPSVITVDGRDDIPRDETLLKQLPEDLEVVRKQAWGPAKLRIISKSDFSKNDITGNKNTVQQKYVRIKRDLANLANNFISIPDPLIYWVPSVVSAALRMYSSKPYDVIFTTSPPHSIHFAGLALSRRLKVPWIADFRDPWVDNVYFKTLKGTIRIATDSWLEKAVITSCSRVIANTGPNRNKLLKRYGSFVSDSHILTITNGFDKQLIDTVIPRQFDKFTICHTGVYYSIMEPYFFFESVARWLNSRQDKNSIMKSIQILMVGTNESEMKPILEKLSLNELVHFIPRVSHEKAISYAKSADLLLVNLGFGDKDKAQGWIPLKLYDYLGCRRPILGILPEGGAASKLIQQTKSGYVISSPDHQAVADILERHFSAYKDNRPEKDFCPNNSELGKYDVCSLTQELANTLDKVFSQKG
ncbi:MAG: glycosyltransferase [Deltaproteobacteria bacterium]|nr:glycosyltransferase [Deltaproteobacteria bacterium]